MQAGPGESPGSLLGAPGLQCPHWPGAGRGSAESAEPAEIPLKFHSHLCGQVSTGGAGRGRIPEPDRAVYPC
jgi:hypothetical protein